MQFECFWAGEISDKSVNAKETLILALSNQLTVRLTHASCVVSPPFFIPFFTLFHSSFTIIHRKRFQPARLSR
ncbi:hypothetical protein BLX24_15865 [Arsenicibacter rosenii]|uniref:Uncharacterized protein n=1 Tax=Arsenicibacter rosenii TaxID=1750698 RepID=A0A1S2VH05_9BACT|nr:hypothetical protein BLX24_15865 [Arsenicibacter rosenii]